MYLSLVPLWYTSLVPLAGTSLVYLSGTSLLVPRWCAVTLRDPASRLITGFGYEGRAYVAAKGKSPLRMAKMRSRALQIYSAKQWVNALGLGLG